MTAKVKVNGIEKEFIVDIGSRISKLPAENIPEENQNSKSKTSESRCKQKRSKT